MQALWDYIIVEWALKNQYTIYTILGKVELSKPKP